MTKIPLQSLEHLEQGSWDDLPAEVFVRGFVRSYARCIGLSSEEASRRYHDVVQSANGPANGAGDHPGQHQAEGGPDEQQDEAIQQGGRRTFGLALLVIIVFIIATITLSLLWQRGAGASAQAQLQPPVDPPSLTRHG